jgi:hypothetical protein
VGAIACHCRMRTAHEQYSGDNKPTEEDHAAARQASNGCLLDIRANLELLCTSIRPDKRGCEVERRRWAAD